jgi:hypothetical protein
MSSHQHLDHENGKVEPKPVGMLVAGVKKLFSSTFSSAPLPLTLVVTTPAVHAMTFEVGGDLTVY